MVLVCCISKASNTTCYYNTRREKSLKFNCWLPVMDGRCICYNWASSKFFQIITSCSSCLHTWICYFVLSFSDDEWQQIEYVLVMVLLQLKQAIKHVRRGVSNSTIHWRWLQNMSFLYALIIPHVFTASRSSFISQS